MNLENALAYNRSVFLRMTGNMENDADAPLKSTGRAFTFDGESGTVFERSVPRAPVAPKDVQNALKTPVYSLNSSGNAETGGFVPLPQIEYPETRVARVNIAPNPLEVLYYQLEVESRRRSQLIGEEEIYG